MIKNFIKVIYRNLVGNPLYSSINIIGLAVSLTCFLLVFIWVIDQLSYDRFFKNSQNIYRVNTEVEGKGVSVLSADNVSPWLKINYPEIINSCRVELLKRDLVIMYGSREFFENGELCADPNFFDLFSYDVVRGDRKKLLDSPDKIVLTETLAAKIFGNTDPIGQVLVTNPGRHKREAVVSGVIKDVPENSHLKFKFVTSLQGLPYWGDGWTYLDLVTYVQLSTEATASSVEKKISTLMNQFNKKENYKLQLQPLVNIHLDSRHLEDAGSISEPGDITYVYIFSVIAALILFLASFNFINLSIARSLKKAKEVKVRKILGAKRRHLIIQFLGESFTSVIASTIIALVVIGAILPEYNEIIGSELKFNMFNPEFLAGLLTIIFFVGIVSGAYPAFCISSYTPLKALQDTSQGNSKGITLKKILVVFQFVLSIAMIISVIVIQKQLRFIMSRDLGFNKDQIVYFNGHDLPFDPKEELLRIPSVQNVSWSSELPLSVDYELQHSEWDGRQNDNLRLHYLRVDHDFLKTFNIQLKEGRNFSKEFLSDEYAYMVNESAAKAMGLASPLGKRLVCLSGLGDKVPGQIVGVVKDFHQNSLRDNIEPLVLGMHIGKPWFVSVKTDKHNIEQTLSQIESTIRRVSPLSNVQLKFLDEAFEKQYLSEKRMSRIFVYFTIFVIAISCLGLFGLVSISVEQSTKEVGIRKVLGASVFEIIIFITKKYFLWIGLAFAIACPIAYFFMNKWLQNFAYRIDIGWWVFILSGGIALAIALATVCYQAIKAATANPVESLRYE